MNLSLKI